MICEFFFGFQSLNPHVLLSFWHRQNGHCA